ncbi:MAG: helix-turn-helix domain-containing protein [Nitrospirae bacterium]|nr:helix-turn-helix domain-containing protein [Nitrospirota bacterium]
MPTLKLGQGNIVYKGDRKYEVIKHMNFKSILVKDTETGKIEAVPLGHLRAEPEKARKEKHGEDAKPEFISDAHWEIAKQRLEIIKPLLFRRRRKEEVLARAGEFGLNVTTLYEWIGAFETTGRLDLLAPLYTKRGGKGKSRLKPEVEAVIENTIKEILEKGQRTTLDRVMEEVKKQCEAVGLVIPHKMTVRRRLIGRSKTKLKKILKGEKMSRPIRGKHEVSVPLEEIQVDESPLDVIVVDEKHRLPIGRGFITISTDVCARVVYGFCVHLEHPSFFTFGRCMSMGILPKDGYLRNIGVKGDWPVWGLPEGVTIHTDNAKWYRGKDMKRFGDTYNLSVTFRPKKIPEAGGHIERLIKTINHKLHELPGSTYSNPQKRGDYDSERWAVLTLKELEKWIVEWIVNVYHRKEHSSLDGMSPIQRWEEGIRGNDTAPGIGLPDIIQGDEAEFLRISLLPTIERTIQRGDVTIERIPYFHEALVAVCEQEWGNRTKLHRFKRDLRDISFLYYLDEDHRTYFRIPYRNPGWPPMSVWELRKVRKMLREKHISDQDPEKIFDAYERMRNIEEEAAAKTKTARRSQEMKRHHTEQLKREAAESKSEAKDNQTERIRSIFANAKPAKNIRIAGKWDREKGENDD